MGRPLIIAISMVFMQSRYGSGMADATTHTFFSEIKNIFSFLSIIFPVRQLVSPYAFNVCNNADALFLFLSVRQGCIKLKIGKYWLLVNIGYC